MDEWFKDNKHIEEIPLVKAISAVRNGMIRLPLYQRDAVWGEGRICALWDSVLRGFPLPSFLLVRGQGLSRGFQNHPLTARGSSVTDTTNNYFDVLDGQQRLLAINAGFPPLRGEPVVRLWIDLAPEVKPHPLKFKFWIHACNKVFPFGFRMDVGGEHDFAVLHDTDIQKLWEHLQSQPDLKGKEFYELPLSKTYPYKAGCAVPLDALIELIGSSKHERTDLMHAIKLIANSMAGLGFLREEQREPQEDIVEAVADSLLRVSQTKLVFQRINIDAGDGYIFFERISRGGVQITQRQLAVSKLMLELGEEGTDAVASFQKSEILQHLMDTEDIIHGLARVASAIADQGGPGKDEDKHDLLDLTPARLKLLQGEEAWWNSFTNQLKSYCAPIQDGIPITKLQRVFEDLYTDLRYDQIDNPYGFSLVQLSQPDKDREGIAPITLHPLLYWYIAYSKGNPPSRSHRDEMLRWLLFANGFTNKPRDQKFNREIFRLVRHSGHVHFDEVTQFVFGNDNDLLRKDLGFSSLQPSLSLKDGSEQKGIVSNSFPTPKDFVNRSARRLLFQNWADTSSPSLFILLWNQRQVMEHLYGEIKYRPALFSKGRPFDRDHIVARNRLLYINLTDSEVRSALASTIIGENGLNAIEELRAEITVTNTIKLSAENFRKHLSNATGNYRYWPKRLNRCDQDKTVCKKMDPKHLEGVLEGHPLASKFVLSSLDRLLRWSAIPTQDKEVWLQLPPERSEWVNNSNIGKFFIATLRRELFLYQNAYDFVMGTQTHATLPDQHDANNVLQ